MPLVESEGGMLWGSQAKVGLVNSNQKDWCLVSLVGGGGGINLRGAQREGPGPWGENAYHKGSGEIV